MEEVTRRGSLLQFYPKTVFPKTVTIFDSFTFESFQFFGVANEREKVDRSITKGILSVAIPTKCSDIDCWYGLIPFSNYTCIAPTGPCSSPSGFGETRAADRDAP